MRQSHVYSLEDRAFIRALPARGDGPDRRHESLSKQSEQADDQSIQQPDADRQWREPATGKSC
ncbi:hypothetical protein D3C85_1440510 [compost metagenome]